MRLTPFEVKSIKESVSNHFEEGSRVHLFGSRVNDQLKGGDIDLYIQTTSTNTLVERKISFLVEIKSKIGDQKIDVVIAEDPSRQIEKEALRNGIEL